MVGDVVVFGLVHCCVVCDLHRHMQGQAHRNAVSHLCDNMVDVKPDRLPTGQMPDPGCRLDNWRLRDMRRWPVCDPLQLELVDTLAWTGG